MLIFPFILIFGLSLLYVNISAVAEGKKGKLVGLGFLVALFASMFLRGTLAGAIGITFFAVWLCQALWMFILWDIFRGLRCLWYSRTKIPASSYKTATDRLVRRGSRIVLLSSILLTCGLIAYGVPHNENYKVRSLSVNLQSQHQQPDPSRLQPGVAEPPRELTAVFFSDLHIDPLLNASKVKRMIAEMDSISPDFILFGGDLADVPSTTLSEWGYDSLFRQMAATAGIAAVGVNGNHEAMQRDSDPEGWLRKNGWIVLDDASACLPAENPVLCFTGRTDFQVARARGISRKSLAELADFKKNEALAFLPWILMDHQPKGIEEEYAGTDRPDFALSGHTHDGQFFPGNLVIGLVWRLAYGEGILDGVHWLVSAGVDSWGPPVRVGSDTEMWVLHLKI